MMRFEVQHTGRPFGMSERIPEGAWEKYTRHILLSRARSAVISAQAEMVCRCGPTSWDDHFRIVALEDTVVYHTLRCRGVDDVTGAHTPCQKETTVTGIWERGEAEPSVYDVGMPEGWHTVTQCESCYMRETSLPVDGTNRAHQQARMGGQGLSF